VSRKANWTHSPAERGKEREAIGHPRKKKKKKRKNKPGRAGKTWNQKSPAILEGRRKWKKKKGRKEAGKINKKEKKGGLETNKKEELAMTGAFGRKTQTTRVEGKSGEKIPFWAVSGNEAR